MKRRSIVLRLGASDTADVPSERHSQVTNVSFIDRGTHLGHGLGQAMEQLRLLGLAPTETAVDLALMAAGVTAADTRISRSLDAQDKWTREIDLHVPVEDPARWSAVAPSVEKMLKFLTGDLWTLRFRSRISGMERLAAAPTVLRTSHPTGVCLFSGGLDSFIGAIDLCVAGERPILLSHYWDGVASKHQTNCANALMRRFPGSNLHHIRARVGFARDTVGEKSVEDTLRGRSFLFFALAALVANSIGGEIVIHVPENGLISLNVPLDPLRLGSHSTRTTHPFYMARFGELLRELGLNVRLHNAYAFKTKGQMAKDCKDPTLLRTEAANTMSCSSPAAGRYDPNLAQRGLKHCGRCVPCLIRRAAIQEGCGPDGTAYRTSLHDRVLNTRKAEGEHVRSFQLALSRLANKPGRARFDIHRPGPLNDHPDDVAKYEAVYVAGLEEVGRLLAGVRAHPL